MGNERYCLLQTNEKLQFIHMPATHAYQLTALHQRLHKELNKLTASNLPSLPIAVAECNDLELCDESLEVISGLDYINELESNFSKIQEEAYPLISLLTEIRALQAQLEQWYEEEMNEF